jgi:hypothetical protein
MMKVLRVKASTTPAGQYPAEMKSLLIFRRSIPGKITGIRTPRRSL